MRILLSAYQCGPGMGSVSQIGWEWYSRLARRSPSTTVTLVTHIRNRECLVRAGAPLPGSEVIYIDTEWFAGPLYRMASRMFPKSEHAVFLISSADFFVYDGAALKQLIGRRNDWDVVHAVTPVSPIAATRLHRMGLPLIVGPWNGGLPSPTAFPEIMSRDSAWVYRIRKAGVILDRLFGCTRQAAMILTATKSTAASLPPHARTRPMIENGVDLKVFRPGAWNAPASKKHAQVMAAESRLEGWVPPLFGAASGDPCASEENLVRVLFVGRLIPFKGVSMLLEAASRLRDEVPLAVTIVGDGPLRAELQHEAAARGLNGIVRFAGAQPLSVVAEYMRNSHVFCLPSVRESGGAVLLESLACALPVLAVNYGGPAEIVDDEVGRTLSAEGREALVRDLMEALRDIARNPWQWRQKGLRGRIRAESNYGWDARMDAAIAIYNQLARGRAAHA